MTFDHEPVLLDESVKNLAVKSDGIYVDGTLGGGGHAEKICGQLGPRGRFIGIDRDQDALDAAENRLRQLKLNKKYVRSNYSNIKNIILDEGIDRIDGALLDLGVSSFQLDNTQRGFSYMSDGPLDMRMDRDDPVTAYDVVNTYEEGDLARLIKEYGEERWAKRIASFICRERKDSPVETTGRLVEIIKKAIPASARREGPHPAKRTFQAIRIEVNDELGQLRKAIEDFCDVLAPGGRLCVITFHSLEDRIVKDIFSRRADPCTCPPDFPVCVCGKTPDIKKVNTKPIMPTEAEKDRNPRARSAKLRVAEKI